MVDTIEVTSEIDELRQQVKMLTERLAKLEMPAGPVLVPAPPRQEAVPDITEEELLAISGALAAYLGVRVHIRQIRLISSRAWAQQGRVSIQASHRLHS